MGKVFRTVVLALALLLAATAVAGAVSPVPPTPQYWWAENGTRHGPVSLDDLKALVAQGKVGPDTLVWTATLRDWQRADTVGDLHFGTANAVTTTYYYVSDQGQQGPVGFDELKALIAAGTVKADTLVWANGMADWQKAMEVADLKELFAPAPSADYYVVAGGQKVGPLTLDQLRARIRSGETTADDLVWKTGMANWDKARTIAELAVAFPPEQLALPEHLTAKTITLEPIGPGMSEAQLHKSSIVLGAVLGIFLHEMGHAMIAELDLPAVGPEEDTADEFSALILGTSFSREQMKDESDPTVIKWTSDLARYSTLLWFYLNQSTNGRAGPWFDEHANTARRFRNTLCRIYGADPITYKDVADKVKLPNDQRRLCTQEYERHFMAWVRIVANVSRDPGGDLSYPGNLPANTPGKKVTMTYEPSKLGTGEALTPVFRDSGIMEGFAEIFSDNFVLTKRDIAVTFKDCGVANAWYDPARGTVTLCWEVVEDFAGAILDAEKVPRH